MSKTPHTYLYMFRHGEAKLNTAKGLFGGRQNSSPLTGEGVRQSERVGRFIARSGIVPTRAYSSTARRAHDTGFNALRVAHIALPITKVEALQELDRGAWTNRSKDEIAKDEEI